MENRREILRNQSQSYLQSSLNHQIELMLPVRHSYSDLQHYHLKVSHDLETLLKEHKQISEILVERLKQQNAVSAQLQNCRAAIQGQSKACNKEHAKLSMDHRSLQLNMESLNSKLKLEHDQSAILINRSRELEDQIRKNLTNIIALQNFLGQLQSDTKQKSLQSESLNNEISKRKDLNHRIMNRNSDLENDLNGMSDKNSVLTENNKTIECQIDSLNCRVQKQQRKTWQFSEDIIERTQQLHNLNNETEYYSQMLAGQEQSSSILLSNIERLENLNANRRADLTNVQSQNTQFIRQIQSEKQSLNKSIQSKELASAHLANIIEMNSLILENMEKWCLEDRNTIKVIESKANRLSFVVNQTRTALGRGVLSNIQNRSRISHTPTEKFKQFGLTGKSWMSTKVDGWKENLENRY